MKNRYIIVISALFLSNFSYSSNDITIYHAKEIVTLDEKVASANAVSVKSDRVMAIGSLDDLIERNPDASIDRQFQNDVIVPGFIEHHIHPFLSAITMNAEIISIEGWDLPNNQSIAYRDRDSYMQRLSEIEENMKSDSPLITWGFHHYFHGDISREDLDRISKDRPILVMHRSYHEFILNTPALEYFDISQEFIDIASNEDRHNAEFIRLDARNLHFFKEFDAVISLCQGAFGLAGQTDKPVATLDPDAEILFKMSKALVDGGKLALSAFSAYFQLHFLEEEKDTFFADHGVNHENATIRNSVGEEIAQDLWTSCFTPRELRLLANQAGLTVQSIWSVSPGKYKEAVPTYMLPELLMVASRENYT